MVRTPYDTGPAWYRHGSVRYGNGTGRKRDGTETVQNRHETVRKRYGYGTDKVWTRYRTDTMTVALAIKRGTVKKWNTLGTRFGMVRYSTDFVRTLYGQDAD